MLASTSRSFSLSPSCFFFVQPTCPISESAHEHASRPLRASCSPVLVQSKRISRRVSRSPSLFFNDSFSLSCILLPLCLNPSILLMCCTAARLARVQLDTLRVPRTQQFCTPIRPCPSSPSACTYLRPWPSCVHAYTSYLRRSPVYTHANSPSLLRAGTNTDTACAPARVHVRGTGEDGGRERG